MNSLQLDNEKVGTTLSQSSPISNSQAVDESMNEDEVQKKKQKNVVHWFRKGLRLHDQPALLKGKFN